MAKKREQERQHLIEILSSTQAIETRRWWTSRSLHEALIERYGTHVSHVNALANMLRILEHEGLVESTSSRERKTYRWR
jgi:hypothetical protein